MALESATYINQLVPSNPNGVDIKGQGDDHLRMIKKTLQQTFPNINGPVLATPAQINQLTNPNVFFTRGMVIMWYGDLNAPPPGWLLCNGTNGTPDLRDRFVAGAGASWGVGAVGGAMTHAHAVDVAGTALTEAQIPSHNHTKTYQYVAGGALNLGFVYNNPDVYHGGGDAISGAGNKTMTTNPTGGSQAHTHAASAQAAWHLPPFMALAFIMRA